MPMYYEMFFLLCLFFPFMTMISPDQTVQIDLNFERIAFISFLILHTLFHVQINSRIS